MGTSAPLTCQGLARIQIGDEHDSQFVADMEAMAARLAISYLQIGGLRQARGDYASNVPGYGEIVSDFAPFTPGGILRLSWKFRNDAEFRREELPKLEAAIAALLEPPPSDDDGGRLIKEAVPLKLAGSAEEPAPEALEPEPEPEPEAEDEDTYCCDRCGEEVHPENAIVTDGGEGPYCEDCYYELYGRCANCDREIFLDDAWQDGNGEMYCERCYERIFTECAACGNELWRDDAIWVDGEAYCEDCAVEHVVEHVEVE